MSFFESALKLEAEELRKIQKEYAECVNQRGTLEAQLMENEIVKQELDFVKDEDNDKVFKLVGPVLVSQELAEAKDTVAKRIDYIKKEVERQTKLGQDLEVQLNEKRDKIQQMQAQATKTASAPAKA
ncbi:hypothetical protein SARC_07364 [Sphaeroforma arctica JP610]|uniref:Prefoldin subunit 6 n=1 Tax=Sphaeroforma arctica JP610 TaxID=667725 RepID=A0A0L0FTV1_9EUKA|nr:hypothetical protein SARC_07364 [Sphaeroforma arctica JP610]KNC80270.1 hypothetical protein SARC_07364 [Sphaeroforma arctica JP610]|eukprot:XP_014154172.1 hypothetical protein SARC_07364 [Sphaeroforma arctica JP610]